MDTFAVRLQVTEDSRLVSEVVGLSDYIASLVSRYALAKWRAGKPCGGMLSQRADLPRYFDVPIGACCECGAYLDDEPHEVRCSYRHDFYDAPVRELEPEY